jgi:hypothetical protein
MIDGQFGHVETQLLSHWKEARAQASEKELSRRMRLRVALLQSRRIDWTNPGKRVCERSCNRYCGIGKGGGSRKPVCACNVKTDRHRNRFGAEAGTAPNDTEQPKRCKSRKDPAVRQYWANYVDEFLINRLRGPAGM